MGGSKNAKKLNEEKNNSIVYQRTKIQKVGSPKNEGLKKPSTLYKVETFNHIIIYNVVFSWINSYHFATFVA